MDSATIYQHVSDRYSATARGETSTHHVETVAQAFGYSSKELASIPGESNLGLSCGNPLALANLQGTETVIDLGCGAGFDVFLAAKKLGKDGKVIGVDMNEHMLAKAAQCALKTNATNVHFLNSRITAINLPNESADVVISNCVINLIPDAEKHLVFKEVYRLLRPGGRLAVSDILTKRPLPEHMKQNMALYVGCIAGASSKEEYENWLQDAGFNDIVILDAGSDLNVYTSGELKSGCCSGAGDQNAELPQMCCGGNDSDGSIFTDMKRDQRDLDLNEWAGSFKIFAVKRVWGNERKGS
ncbi:ubiE/COQ5 methyltransferase [Paraphoma chrysanthemicola]|uniref:Arsenite methyltransferase n=1 Tax=Paraphoma chrysanthemicola TaxID=798071 RepID=A0A8K0QT73_9PLEO|nr:ubiE/COQ5 methyltransferase [Paraphoma chrysanthemicola]